MSDQNPSWAFDTARTNPGAAVPAPPPTNPNATPNQNDILRLIEDRVSQVESRNDAKIKALEQRHRDELKAARGLPSVDSRVPTHGGGPGDETSETWSQYHQELSRAGNLTDAHLRDVRGEAPEETNSDE